MAKPLRPAVLAKPALGLILAVVVGCSDMYLSDISRPTTRQSSHASPIASVVSNRAGAAGEEATLPNSGTGTDASGARPSVARAILVSVDGLGAKHLKLPSVEGSLNGFTELMQAGSSTLNARADYEWTVTLPNHTTQLTGRPVARDLELPANAHHGWMVNSIVEPSITLHNAGNPELTYVSSIFDVAHDRGKSTCMYAGKAKFMLFANSYNSTYGAPDRTGTDQGRNKLDRVLVVENSTEQLISAAEADITAGLCDLTFIHIADLDTPIGHSYGWGTNEWYAGLALVDGWLARLLRLLPPNSLGPSVGLVVTADHGGTGAGHSDATDIWNYQIPFFAVGPGFTPNSDLYKLVGGSRQDPGTERPRYSAPRQPIRNADAANVLMVMMGLPLVPGAFMRDLLPPN